jgi:3-hydroxyacyl-CoA dehydrogenase
MRSIRRVGVLGAGTMGSRIAAHFANAGIPATLLDIVRPGSADRSAASKSGLESAVKQRPAGFYTDSAAALVTPGNFEDNLDELGACDWIIEAVTENLEIKRSLWKRIELVRRPDAILSTNTSGIPLAQISQGFSPEFRGNFLGTHFFNPPRYLHLVEVIPGAETSAGVIEFVSGFCDVRLGKGVVPCKDTPNFVANRIGSFVGATVYQEMIAGDYTIEEVELLTGPLIGIPKTASFRLLDLVGLDVWAFVAKNLYDAVPHDPWRERFLPPPFLNEMIQRGWLGDKTGQGFYKKVGKEKEIWAIDWKTLEYHVAARPKFPSVEAAKAIEDLPTRLKALVAAGDKAGAFLWKVLSEIFLYSVEMIPEISDRVVEIDRAMRWGYGHKLGPFELWDALGFVEIAQRMQNEGRRLPSTVQGMLANGATSFYRAADVDRNPHTEYFDLLCGNYERPEERPGILVLSDTKRARGVVQKNAGASLVDVGDGVLCLEFHSKMNSLGEDAVSMIYAGVDETSRNFEAMIIANEGDNFSAGANLMLVLLAAQEGEWDDLNNAVYRFQKANMAIKYAPKPVVAAPFGMTLGGGCEIVLHSARAQASAELYMGLVEAGVGLIPAGGGCKELLIRLKDPRKIFELIGYAKVSASAEDARNLGLLHKADRVSMNKERLIADAKELALSLKKDYSPGPPRTDVKVSGESGFALMKLGAWSMRQGGFISDHDVLIAEKLAGILSGGRLTGEQTVSEQYLLDLEREAFLSLCGTKKTQERMQHMLKTGKPLRN